MEIARLDFQKPDMQNLPCLRLARNAAEQGGSAPAILNAANEIAVAAFLDNQIRFTDIPKVIEFALNNTENVVFDDIDSVLKIDHEARVSAQSALDSLAH